MYYIIFLIIQDRFGSFKQIKKRIARYGFQGNFESGDVKCNTIKMFTGDDFFHFMGTDIYIYIRDNGARVMHVGLVINVLYRSDVAVFHVSIICWKLLMSLLQLLHLLAKHTIRF